MSESKLRTRSKILINHRIWGGSSAHYLLIEIANASNLAPEVWLK